MKTMSDGFHPPVEEYLEAIHSLDEEGAQVIQARLAERLGHSAPSVSETVRRLKADGYVLVTNRTAASRFSRPQHANAPAQCWGTSRR